VASGVAKPDGLLVIPVGSELAFLHPLPVERLWGVGRVTSGVLRSNRITTVRQVAALHEQTLVDMLGRASGRKLHALAHNRDPRRVRRAPRRRSIGAQRALGRRARPPGEIDEALMTLIDRVCRRMRMARRACRTVVLRMRFDDFTRATRSHTVAEATDRTSTLLKVARGLLRASRPLIRERGLTLIGITLTNLCDRNAIQLALPFDRTSGLDTTIDAVRERFGSGAINRGALVGKDSGPWVPLLPD
jgi:DNA polymerase-4